MKHAVFLSFVVVMSTLLVACGPDGRTGTETPVTPPLTASPDTTPTGTLLMADANGEYNLDTQESQFIWEGSRITGSGHEGTVDAKAGEIIIQDGEFVSGYVVMDMTTIVNTDNGYSERLVNHLKSDDFFGVEAFPTSTLTINDVSENNDGSYLFLGTLQIRDIAQDIEFSGRIESDDDRIRLITFFEVDREVYGIARGLQDLALKEQMNFNVDAVFTK